MHRQCNRIIILFILLQYNYYSLYAQNEMWQIKGAISALSDSSAIMTPIILQSLYNLKVIDSLIQNNKIPSYTFSYCRAANSENRREVYCTYLLAAQNKIPIEDLNILKNVLMDRNSFDAGSVWNILGAVENPSSELISLCRLAWDSASFQRKTSMVKQILHQKTVPKNDFEKIKNYLATKEAESLKWGIVGY